MDKIKGDAMKCILSLIFTMCSFLAYAQNVDVQYRLIKPAIDHSAGSGSGNGQAMLEQQFFTNPAAAGTADIVSGHAGITTTADVSITSFVAQPDLPRNLSMTTAGTAADVGECTVTVSGTDFNSASISEEFTVTENTSVSAVGNKAFRTVTSISIPEECEASPYGVTWSVGYGEKLGLKNCLLNAGTWVFSTVAGAYESTRATIAASSSAVSGNTADFNGTMNGSNDFIGYFIQNWAASCFP